MQPLNWYCFRDIHALTSHVTQVARPLTYVTVHRVLAASHSRSHSPIVGDRRMRERQLRACVRPRPSTAAQQGFSPGPKGPLIPSYESGLNVSLLVPLLRPYQPRLKVLPDIDVA
jgi:hypothetical protein